MHTQYDMVVIQNWNVCIILMIISKELKINQPCFVTSVQHYNLKPSPIKGMQESKMLKENVIIIYGYVNYM